jgi:peptide/nickel transport system permease protein
MTRVGIVIVALTVAAALVGPWATPYDPSAQELPRRLEGPSLAHPFGLDELGRDILSRILTGARISLLVGISVVGVSATLGMLLGATAGYVGGRLDDVVSRVMDVLLAFPGILLAIALVAVLGPSLGHLILALSVIGWVGYARLVRAQALRARELEFVQAARAARRRPGAHPVRHVLPTALPAVVVQGTLGMAGAIIAEASLSFLGLGVQPPTPSWGTMLDAGRSHLFDAPHLTIFPGLAIALARPRVQFSGGRTPRPRGPEDIPGPVSPRSVDPASRTSAQLACERARPGMIGVARQRLRDRGSRRVERARLAVGVGQPHEQRGGCTRALGGPRVPRRRGARLAETHRQVANALRQLETVPRVVRQGDIGDQRLARGRVTASLRGELGQREQGRGIDRQHLRRPRQRAFGCVHVRGGQMGLAEQRPRTPRWLERHRALERGRGRRKGRPVAPLFRGIQPDAAERQVRTGMVRIHLERAPQQPHGPQHLTGRGVGVGGLHVAGRLVVEREQLLALGNPRQTAALLAVEFASCSRAGSSDGDSVVARLRACSASADRFRARKQMPSR